MSELILGIDPDQTNVPSIYFNNGVLNSYNWGKDLIDTCHKKIVGVKFQSAYFESLGLQGLTDMSKLIAYSKSHDLITIMDAKRGDIGSTSRAYAKAFLENNRGNNENEFACDYLTVNPLMGEDCLDPFVEIALKNNKSKSSSWIIFEFEKSYILEKKGNIDLSISIIEKVSNYKNFRNKALIRISNIYRRNNDYKKSMEILDRIDFSKIVSPEVFYYRSLNLVLMKDWKNAIESFDTLLAKYPNNPEISNFVGYTLVDRNIRLDEGIDLIQFAVSKEPQNGFFLDSLGWAFYLTGLIDKSIFYLEKAVSMMPNDATLNDHLGDAYWKSGRRKEASSQWKRVLIIEPNFKNKEKILEKLELGIK